MERRNMLKKKPVASVTSMGAIITTLLAFIALETVIAQTPSTPFTFEVATIKPSAPGGNREGGGWSCRSDRCVYTRTNLKLLISIAYYGSWASNQLLDQMVLGGPSWTASDPFDIQAKAERPATTDEQFRQMLQQLLADRFKLKVHREIREIPGYVLVIAKNGHNLTKATGDEKRPGSFSQLRGRIVAESITLSSLASLLSDRLGAVVQDQTGLTEQVQCNARLGV
jgi:uncharacterized protein (TIGR03435 family)